MNECVCHEKIKKSAEELFAELGYKVSHTDDNIKSYIKGIEEDNERTFEIHFNHSLKDVSLLNTFFYDGEKFYDVFYINQKLLKAINRQIKEFKKEGVGKWQ